MIVNQLQNKSIPLINHHMVEYKVIKEPVYKYTLADGSTILGRFVMLMIHFEKTIEEIVNNMDIEKTDQSTGVNINHKIIFAINANDEMKGEPNRKKDTNLREHVVEEDVEITYSYEPFFEYELKNGFKLKGKMVLMNVDRTDIFDENWMPIYLLDHTVQMKLEIPKKIRKKIDKMRKKIQ